LYSKFALKDAKKLSRAKLDKKARNLKGAYSRRINIQHRMVYEVREKDKVVRVLRMWSHYE